MAAPALASLEVENVAEWATSAASLSLAPVTHSSSSTRSSLILTRPRPRTINQKQTTSFLQRLSRHNLEWHVDKATAMVYALKSVGGVNVKADKTLMTIELPDATCSQPRMMLIEKESALKTILLDSIVSVAFDKTDETKRSLRIVYWFDKNRPMNAPPTHPILPTSASSSTAPTAINIAAASPTAKQFLLTVVFSSYLDARDVFAILTYLINYGIPTDGPLFRNSDNTPAEFVVLHAGYLEKKGKKGLTWSKRYAELYAGFRLVVYRTDKSVFPVNVFTLVRGEGEPRLVSRAVGKDQIGFDLPTTTATNGTDTVATNDPLYLFRFSSQRERDRWLQAFKIEYDQPLKDALKKPGPSSTSNTDAVSSPKKIDAPIIDPPKSVSPTPNVVVRLPTTIDQVNPAVTAAQAKERVAELNYTYYNQLLTLCASPEVLRMNETDELVIPRDGSQGNVNQHQFTRAPMPIATNPKLMRAKSTEVPAASSSFSLTVTPSTPTPKESIPSPHSSFNPLTHQKLTIPGLLAKLQDQHLYFAFLSFFRTKYSSTVFKTALPSVARFHDVTPKSSLLSKMVARRGDSLSSLDKALQTYQTFLAVTLQLLRDSKLLCCESDASAMSTNSSQIGFAFPGFDSQVFDIGRFSVVSPGQMFLGLDGAFQEEEWQSALKASSIGKELMQSCSDYTALFESDKLEDQNHARTLMHNASLEVLHNIALASYIRSRWSSSLANDKQHKLREGDIIPFNEVLIQFEIPAHPSEESEPTSPRSPKSPRSPRIVSSTSSPASGSGLSAALHEIDLFQYSKNHMQLEQFNDVTYVYAPTRQVLQQYLKTRIDAFERDHPDQAAALGSSEGNIAFIEDSSSSATSKPSIVMPPLPGVHSSPNSSPRRSPQPEPDTSDTIMNVNPIHPSFTTNPPTTASQIAHPPNSTPAAIQYPASRHFLFDSFHFLLFIRLIFDYRKTLLDQVENTVHVWLSKYQKDSSKSKSSMKYENITILKETVADEKKRLLGVMNCLPTVEVIEGVIKLQTRLSAQTTLSHFLPSRPQLSDLTRSAPVAAASLTLSPDQLATRTVEKSQRKSFILHHIQTKVAQNAATATTNPNATNA